MTKKELREKARALRNSIKSDKVIQWSATIQNRVCNHLWFKQANTVFVYVSMDNEVRTNDIIHIALNEGKRVCVPRVIPDVKMEAVPINNVNSDLQLGFYNILEPKPHLSPIAEKEMDFVIVPGLIFDRNCYRIGYGGGYYDRYLAALSSDCTTTGIAYDFQIIDKLPIKQYDMSVMEVITEKEIIKRS